jgi:hypothetical protein
MNLKLFFSHAWNDKAGAKVKKLLLLLQKDYEVWLDKKQIDNGDHINNTVAKGIEDCHIFVNIWSENAHKSRGVLFELETAAKLNKHILALCIDKFDINQSPQLAGKEYIDFSGNDFEFAKSEVTLTNFLLRKKIAVLKKYYAGTPNEAIVLEMEKKMNGLQDILIEVEDTSKRQILGASGNDDSDVYIQSTLNTFEKTLSPEEEDDKLMLSFSSRMKEISAKYPLQKDDKIKKQLALQAICQIDPSEKNTHLLELKKALQTQVGNNNTLTFNNETSITSNTAINNSGHAAILAAYKASIEKTKTIVLEKSKSGLESIPLFDFLNKLSTGYMEVEMSYVTNSPQVLESLYNAALQSTDRELLGLVSVLIRHITKDDLEKCESQQKINAYNHYAYLINNTARLLVQAKAIKEQDVAYSLISSTGLDKLSKVFFKDDWQQKTEQFLEAVKNNYGIKDKNLQWLTAAATVIGVALIADGLSNGLEGDAGGGETASNNTNGDDSRYFEDKMASVGLSMPNTVQW